MVVVGVLGPAASPRRPRQPQARHTQIDSNSVTVSISLMSKPSNSAPKPNPSNDDLLAMGIDPKTGFPWF